MKSIKNAYFLFLTLLLSIGIVIFGNCELMRANEMREVTMKECVLYYTAACPFCQKVLHFMKEHNISLISKDTRKDPQAREELIQIGGKPQVPCLVIDGQAMYESDAIISWLNTSY